MMKALAVNRSAIAAVILFAMLSLVMPEHGKSDESVASTDSFAIMQKHPDLKTGKLDAVHGSYAAIMKNGDTVMASFSTCGLGRNRRLKRDEFKLPLTDKDGTVHKFTYTSDYIAKIYILSYQVLPRS